MRILLSLLLILSSLLSHAQDWDFEKPNYKKIEKNIQKKNSPLFYESLMKRFLEGDTSMSIEEKRHLYYGYTFHEDYSPYGFSAYNDSLQTIFKKANIDSLDYVNIIQYSNAMLTENPFDLGALDVQLYALEKTQDTALHFIRLSQLRSIIDALISSGNGVKMETAFYVISTSHEYELLTILGLQFGGTQSLVDHYDYLELAENDAGLEGLYFDVSPCLNSLNSMFED